MEYLGYTILTVLALGVLLAVFNDYLPRWSQISKFKV